MPRESEWSAWMRAALEGDKTAYESLLRDLAPSLRPLMRRGLAQAGRSVTEAEDIVQDVLLTIHLKRHTWDSAQPLGPWVRAIARHKLIDSLRRRGSRYDLPIEDFAETIAAEDGDEAAPARDVERSLEQLSSRQQAVVRAIALDGASIAETADRLRMTQGAVRVALHRGLTTISAWANR